ncbi:MAG: hypothetical protein AB7L92_02990 [Alphaproteobacteria bacterium]
MKKNLLFVTYGGGHAHMVYPVVHALRKRTDALTVHVLGLPAAKHTLKANGIEPLGFNDYLDKEKDADALEWGRRLAREHHSPTIGIDLEDSVAYLGLCFKDLVTRLGLEEAEKLFAQQSRRAFYPLTIMERIFADLAPDMVITSNSPRSEAAAIATANAQGITSMIMTDLFTGLGDYPLVAQHITFLNEVAKDMFIADGLVDERISQCYITGNPAFDKILDLPKDKDAEWLQQHFPQAGGAPLVLHADMPAYWDPIKKCSHIKSQQEILGEMEACYNATVANDAVYLVRPHPSQDRAFYARWVDAHPGAYLTAECNLHELLANIDLLVARTTTVGLEAAIMEKKILQLDADFHADMPLASMGIAWGVNSYGELVAAIASALKDDKKLEKINKKVKQLLPREQAAAKIADIILELL